jgi:translocator protein
MSFTLKLIISIVVCLAIGGISGGFTAGAINTWYVTLQKPSWNPPNTIFAPVWTTLYIGMAIAFARIWDKADSDLKTSAMILFGVQLFLNFWWSIIFFNFRTLGWALVEIGVMWLAIVATIFYFSKLDRIAMALLIPYIAWVSFAAFLNFTLWRMNG